MPECFEATFGRQLADLFVGHLRRAVGAAGFDEVLRIPEPDVTEYRRGHEVLTLTVEDAGHHERRLALESEATDVRPIVSEAAKLALLEVAQRLLAAMPWVDRTALERDLDQVLQEGLTKPEPSI